MHKTLLKLATAATGFAAMAGVALAAGPTLEPWVYDPDNTGIIVAEMQGDVLRLEKNGPTETNAAAGAEILNVAGMSTTDMTLSFDVEGYCGAGAPRFNVYLESGGTIFLGCIHGDADADGTVIFEAGQTYGGVLFPEGETVTGIDIVQDEMGQTSLTNIMVNEQEVELPPEINLPTSKDDCKNGGHVNYTNNEGVTFPNQGQCVSFYNHMN